MKKQYDIKALTDSLSESAFFQSQPVKQNPISKDGDASKLVNQEASKEANQLASKPANEKTSLLASQQTSNMTSPQSTKNKRKYGTYLTSESIKAIQIEAVKTNMKDHEIVQLAV